MTETIVGLDIGGTKWVALEGTLAGEILAREQQPTRPEEGFAATFDCLSGAVARRLSAAQGAGRRVLALSVSIGGPLDSARGIIYSPPNLPGWDAIPLKALLEGALACRPTSSTMARRAPSPSGALAPGRGRGT